MHADRVPKFCPCHTPAGPIVEVVGRDHDGAVMVRRIVPSSRKRKIPAPVRVPPWYQLTPVDPLPVPMVGAWYRVNDRLIVVTALCPDGGFLAEPPGQRLMLRAPLEYEPWTALEPVPTGPTAIQLRPAWATVAETVAGNREWPRGEMLTPARSAGRL